MIRDSGLHFFWDILYLRNSVHCRQPDYDTYLYRIEFIAERVVMKELWLVVRWRACQQIVT